MRNLTAPTFISLCLLLQTSLFAQLSENLENLEGAWYQETRNSITYSNWQNLGDQTYGNQIFSIVCGDTVLQSSALLRYSGETATLKVACNGKLQQFRLTLVGRKKLTWENENPNDLPKKLEWKFWSGGYATFSSDDIDTELRKEVKQPFKIRVRASLGANLNQYANPVGVNRFLANRNAAAVQGATQMDSGSEAAISLGMIFPTTPLCLNFELGMAYRQVGVQASFYNIKAATQTTRDGYYRNYNYYFAVVPEVFAGRNHNFSISAGFYMDIFQQSYFRGKASVNNGDSSKSFYTNPGMDIDSERGLVCGLNYRVRSLNHARPQVYLRYTHGLNNTQVRAIALGAAIEFEIK